MEMYVVWIILLIAFIILETITVSITSIWFACGAVAAMIISMFFSNSLPAQIIVFFLVSALMLWRTRPLVAKYITKQKVATNADRVIGMTGTVTQKIDNIMGQGEVYVDGKRWTARSANGAVIEDNTLVNILWIEGVKVIVELQSDPQPVKEIQ